jgi:phage gpG-like protein
MSVTKYTVDPDKDFAKAISEALKECDDLTVPLTLIAKSWFKSNKAIFQLKGPGKYTDLSENYKKQKKKAVGFIYPILRRSGVLEESITNPTDSNSINLIINKNTLILGTKVPYASKHQFGEGVPRRPFVLIGAEQTGPEEFNQRRAAWIKTIQTHVLQVSGKLGKAE